MRIAQARRLPFTYANAVLLVEMVRHLLSIANENFSIAVNYSDYRSKCHFFVLL